MNELRGYMETTSAANLLAARQASAEGDELTEAVLQEALRLLREEFRAELKKVEDATQQLTLRAEAQESHFKEFTRLYQEAKDRSGNSESEQAPTVVEQVQEIHDEHKKMLGTMDTLMGRCDETFAQIQSACVCHDASSRINDQMEVPDCVSMKISTNDAEDFKSILATREQVDEQLSDLWAQVSWIKNECGTFASKEHVDERISSIHELLSQLKDENTGDQLSEIRRQMHLVASNWEVMRGATFTELRKHGAATKERMDKKIAELTSELRRHKAATIDHVEERISKLHMLVSQNQGQQEAKHASKINDEQLADKPWEIRGDLEGAQRQAEHVPSSLGEDTFKLMLESTNEQVLQMKKEIEDIRAQLSEGNVTEGSFTCIEKKIAELLAELRRNRTVTKDLVDERISELQLMSQIKGNDEATHLSRIDEEPLADQLLEIRGEVQELQMQLSECREQPRCEEALKAMMELTEEQVSQMKELVDRRISELDLSVSKSEAETDVKVLSEKAGQCMLAQLEEMRRDVDEVQRQLAERTLEPTNGEGTEMEHTNDQALPSKKQPEAKRTQSDAKLESVAFSDLEALEEATQEYVAEQNSGLRTLVHLEPFDDTLDVQACACVSPINGEQKVALVEQQSFKARTEDHVDEQTVSSQVHWSEKHDEGVNDEVLVEDNIDVPERSLRGVHYATL